MAAAFQLVVKHSLIELVAQQSDAMEAMALAWSVRYFDSDSMCSMIRQRLNRKRILVVMVAVDLLVLEYTAEERIMNFQQNNFPNIECVQLTISSLISS